MTIAEQTVFYRPVVNEAHMFGLFTRFRMLGLLVTEMGPLPVQGPGVITQARPDQRHGPRTRP
ncbi:hypothetical protein AB0D12_39255 [Streptomyces sp. NPDC048479]|uniref:hypothetical protein n=1 Tax=Streptomyces sp. NPDC048479 TaxID=3154725 RepID=UPI003442ADAE